MSEEKKEEEKKPELGLETQVKALYAMVMRATEMAAIVSFQVVALLEDLNAKGIVDMHEVQNVAKQQGLTTLSAIRKMSQSTEAELDEEIAKRG